MNIEPIAYIHTEFSEKFGVPRQSGLARSLRGSIIFVEKYRNPEALRGLQDFSHLWLIWEFSANRKAPGEWHPTVRPPRLGGNSHIGVFASRSPFRPNPLGLSCVAVDHIDMDTPQGPVIHVRGADLMDGTPIYDIKPYIRYADCRPEAVCGYVDDLKERSLKVVIPSAVSEQFPDKSIIPSLVEVLQLDPRPSYQDDPERVYGISFAGMNVRFRVSRQILEVLSADIIPSL